MPELPEVETIRNCLIRGGDKLPSLVNSQILQANVFWEKTIAEPDTASFIQNIRNQVIQAVRRRGKFLIIDLDDRKLIIHLRMSGDIFLMPLTVEKPKHTRLELLLDNHFKLHFVNPRKFGRVWLVEDEHTVLGHLGPDPLEPDFSADVFRKMLKRKRRQLKPLLLDQRFIAGLGNIYSSEALFRAGLHPLRIASDLSDEECEKLYESVVFTLREGIRYNGASIDWVYRGGGFQNYFSVYQRDGEPCKKCGTAIVKIVVGQRGTFYCPQCQPEKHNSSTDIGG